MTTVRQRSLPILVVTIAATVALGSSERATDHDEVLAGGIEIQVGALTFDALALGPEDGELVLMLHGFPQSAYCWRYQMPALAKAGYRVVAPNQRGYSPRARPEPVNAYAIGFLAEDVIDMANALGAERFHLVGHDWGGAVAWVVATRFPNRIRTLSVLSTPHYRAFGSALRNPDSSQGERSSYFSRFAAEGAEHDFLDGDAAGLREIVSGAGLAESDIDHYVRVLGEPEAMRAALNWYAAMTPRQSAEPRATTASGTDGSSSPPKPDPSVAGPTPQPSAGSRIRVPTLYVWGTEDSAFSRDAAEATADFVSAPYRFEVLEGVGHWIPETASNTVNPLLLQQLEQSGQP